MRFVFPMSMLGWVPDAPKRNKPVHVYNEQKPGWFEVGGIEIELLAAEIMFWKTNFGDNWLKISQQNTTSAEI